MIPRYRSINKMSILVWQLLLHVDVLHTFSWQLIKEYEIESRFILCADERKPESFIKFIE